jgi:hypothetical protein
MAIDICGIEYECWHEAGHAVACIACGGKVELMEIIKDGTQFGRARARCETTEASRPYIACGGFAAEYLLHKSGILSLSEKDFVRSALINAFPDKTAFFGKDHEQENGCWPPKMDMQFMMFAINKVAPILESRFALLRELAEALAGNEYLAGEQICEITRKHNH